jgi:predicted lipoprotein with Yx(FWY)xxD motif
MALRSLVRQAVIVAAGLAALAACGTPAPPITAAAPPAALAPAPSAEQQAPSDGSQFGQVIATDPPSVVRTQGRVDIYGGASTTQITLSPDHASNKIQLQAVVNAQIGTYVSDNDGMTLYRFDKDTAKPSKSNCQGDCAVEWPPLLVKSPGQIYNVGVDASTVGYVERPDGTCQVTIAGWPVYYFEKDQQPGDIKGQGVGNTWFAINPKGGKTGAVQQSSEQPTGGPQPAAPGQSTGGPQPAAPGQSYGYDQSGNGKSSGGGSGYGY